MSTMEEEIVKERPIPMSAPNIQPILEGRKTHTRRLVRRLAGFGKITEFGKSDTPGYDWTFRDRELRWHDISHTRLLECCPYGKPGDGLWVRENGWEEPYQFGYVYDADDATSVDDTKILKSSGWKRRPSIFMPRWASRILLKITDVRVERLQDISEEDAVAEGCGWLTFEQCNGERWECTVKDEYRTLWESINGPGSWDANPWVWVIEFKKI